MQCARCGTVFDGRFCPECGTPVAAPPGLAAPAPAAPPAYFRCSRCGTTFEGKFCPRCGFPSWAVWIPPRGPAPPSPIYPLLSVVWVASLVAFLVVLVVAIAGLAGSIGPIVTGIGDIGGGGTLDGGFGGGASPWTFGPWTPAGAAGAMTAAGGNPGGFASMDLDGTPASVGGYWIQAFNASGSSPYLAELALDYRVLQTSPNLTRVTLSAYVDADAAAPRLGTDVWNLTLTQAGGWTPASAVYSPTGEVLDFIDVSARVPGPGTYYLKIAALALNLPGGASAPTVVGFDNVRLRWATYAFVDFVVIVPVPIELYFTQDPTVFYGWTAFLVAAAVATLLALVWRDARRAWAAIRLPLENLPGKLRSRSVLVAVAQTFLAIVFVNIVVALSVPTQEPSFFSAIPPWYFLYTLFNATVYEEIIFRVLLIGFPLLVGSLISRIGDVTKGNVPAGTTKGRYVLGSLRYLYGGGLSRATSLVVLLPALFFLLVNAVVFGLAHAPGYGDWKVLPAAIAGLAMGYLFLRHGLHASILFHFSTNMFVAAITVVGEASDASLFLNLLYLLLAVPGAGFFAYYFVYAYRLARDVVARARPGRAPATPVATGGAAPGLPAAASGGVPAPPPVPPGYPHPPAPASGYPPPLLGPGGYPLPSEYVPSSRPPVYGMAPVQYRCPRCGWVEAVYESGRFRCARCGYVS